MHTEIEKVSKIKRNKLSEIDYLESLVKKACEIHLLSLKEIENIQTQLFELLKIKIEKYNLLDGSSIEIEKAKTIMDSNMYTISMYLKTFSPDEAILKLKEEKIISMYEKGQKLINKKITVSKILYRKVLNSTLQIANETYIETIFRGLKGFFKIYDPQYNSKEKKITADYPLYNNLIGKLEGIEFIEEYLKSLLIENEYLSKYEAMQINELLYSYRIDFIGILENIFKIVLIQNIGQLLAGEEMHTLKISKEGIEKIYCYFEKMSKKEIYDRIKETILKLEFKNVETKEYIEKGLEELQFEIYNSYNMKSLDKIFISF